MSYYTRPAPPTGSPVSQMYTRHSPTALNMFASSPAMFVLERVLGQKQPVGAIAHRGSAVEMGVAHGLMNPDAGDKACIDIALASFDIRAALSGDARKEKMRDSIPDMVSMALDELRPLGPPSEMQGFIEHFDPSLKLPIVGYFDFAWADKGLIIDLKTTDKMPSSIKVSHARQVAFYTSDNHEGRLTYCTPKKCQTLQLENAREHKQSLVRMAQNVETFLSQSEDPAFFVTVTAPDLDNYLWTNPAARQIAFELWGI